MMGSKNLSDSIYLKGHKELIESENIMLPKNMMGSLKLQHLHRHSIKE